MSFDGPALSFDDEGSILFDGEKFIVNVPADDDLLEHFNPPENIPFPVVYTHPSYAQNQQAPAYVPTPCGNPILNKEKAIEHVERARKTRESATNGQSQSDVQDIPADLPAETKPDISETEVFEVCGHFCQQNSQAMTAVMNIIEGFDPEADEQTLEQRVSNHLRIMGLNDAFGHGDWYTTRLDPIVPRTAERIVDHYFDRAEASKAALAAKPVTHAESTPAQSQVQAGTDGFVQSEISFLLQWGLTEAFPGEWDPRWTTKEELQDFLVSDLKRGIVGFNESARIMPGFEETVINWADLDVEEMMALYRVEIALELAARAEHHEGFPPGYDEIKASLDWARELESMARPIPLDDTEAYARAFAGLVAGPDAEDERKHVQGQLAVIYEHLNIEMPENYLEGRSTTELKYELYYRLNYDVQQFISLDENEKENRIGKFVTEYHRAAGVAPEGVIDRLQGTYRQPDVLGFLFIMGLSIAYEPVDWVLTAADVSQALSEDDIESAVGNFILGAAPILNSKMDDILQPFFGRLDNVRLLPAYSGWNSRQTDALTQGRIVVPGSKGGLHQELDAIDSRPLDSRFNVNWKDPKSAENTISGRAENDIGELFKGHDYNVVIKPTDTQLAHPGIGYKGTGKPDLIIEGEVFDVYSPNRASPRNIASNIEEKLKRGQADRIIVDITESTVTEGELAYQFKEHGDGMLYNLNKGTDLRELWIRKNDQLFPFLTVENNRIRMLWP